MKKTTFILSALSFFAIASTAYAQAKGFVPLAPIPDLTTGKIAAEAGLASFFNNLYKYLIGLAATLAVIQITWAGIEIAFNKEDVSKITDNKGKIYNALLGLVLVLAPVLVFTIINPSILNLSLNLPPLETKFTPATGAGTGLNTNTAPATAAATASECSTSRAPLGATGSATAGCPTQQAAQEFAAACPGGSGTTYLSGDPSYPYAASCSALQPLQGGHRDYTDKTLIPSGYWCYLTKITAGNNATLTYICGADKNSCDALVLSKAGGGTYAGGCRTAPF
jgi:hypothetical protein